MALFETDPNQLTVTLGVFNISGFLEGSVLTADRVVPVSNSEIDANGNTIRFRATNNDMTIVFNLSSSSPANDILSAMLNGRALGLSDRRSLMIKENNGTSFINTPICYIENTPQYAPGTTDNGRSWTLRAINPTFNFGGLTEVN